MLVEHTINAIMNMTGIDLEVKGKICEQFLYREECNENVSLMERQGLRRRQLTDKYPAIKNYNL